MAPGPLNWEQKLARKDGRWTLTIKPLMGEHTFAPVDTNGSERGGRPLIAFLPQRIKGAKLLEGEALAPVIGDDFVLIPNPGTATPARELRVVFQSLEN